jgi:catechol 1,2-dioxygenase
VGLVTELFPQDSEYIDNDTVFGVREGLIVPFTPCQNTDVAERYGLTQPFLEVNFDFHLVKAP